MKMQYLDALDHLLGEVHLQLLESSDDAFRAVPVGGATAEPIDCVRAVIRNDAGHVIGTIDLTDRHAQRVADQSAAVEAAVHRFRDGIRAISEREDLATGTDGPLH